MEREGVWLAEGPAGFSIVGVCWDVRGGVFVFLSWWHRGVPGSVSVNDADLGDVVGDHLIEGLVVLLHGQGTYRLPTMMPSTSVSASAPVFVPPITAPVTLSMPPATPFT